MSVKSPAEKADGEAGERRCAALLTMALCGKPTVAGLREERQKVDLTCSFPDPLQDISRNVNCQVKSGVSFRANASTKERIRLQNIDEDTLNVFRYELGILAWVPPKPDSAVYWHLCRSNSARAKIIINAKVDRISPALRFIIAREAAQRRRAGAFSQQIVPAAPDPKELLKSSRALYRTLKQGDNPLFGSVHFTQLAWRHITRRSKSATRRNLSLRAVRLLKQALTVCPDAHTVKAGELRREGTRQIESRTIVCWYANALQVDTSVAR